MFLVISDVGLGTIANSGQVRKGLIVGLACAYLELIERSPSTSYRPERTLVTRSSFEAETILRNEKSAQDCGGR